MAVGYPHFYLTRIWFAGTAAAPQIKLQYSEAADAVQAANAANFTVTPTLAFTASYAGGVTSLAIGVPLAALDHQDYLVEASPTAIQDQGTHLHVLGSANNHATINRGGMPTEFRLVFDVEGKRYHAARVLKGFLSSLFLPQSPGAPLVSNVIPEPGSGIVATDVIQFDVTDRVALRRVLLVADYPKLRLREVIHDGNVFGPAYLNSRSTMVVINGGFRYAVLRNTGWPESPSIIAYAIDQTGAENV